MNVAEWILDGFPGWYYLIGITVLSLFAILFTKNDDKDEA